MHLKGLFRRTNGFTKDVKQMASDYRNSRFMENFNIFCPPMVCGDYDIPMMDAQSFHNVEFVGYNYAKGCKNKSGKGVHFFLDDYQFERVWREPAACAKTLMDFSCVMTPDFSMYTDFPKALQIYNHYRKQWLGAYWQALGMTVIPTIAWSDADSYAWCFDGIPQNATVAVSSVGTQNSKEAKALFLQGWDAMMDRLQPETVIFYGQVPKECNANIVSIKAYQEKFREVKTNGW